MTGISDNDARDGFSGEFPSYPLGLASITAEAVLAAEKQALELLVQGAPVAEVLRNLTSVVEDAADGDAFAVILIRDPQGHLRTASAPSLPPAFIEALDGLSGASALGLATVAGTPTIALDVADDPAWVALRGPLARLGLQSAWSYPIMTRDNGVLGIFLTFFRERRRPSTLELRLVETLSQTVVLATDRQEAETAMAAQQLVINELNHRVKNTLATVQAIGMQALKASSNPETARATFESRIHSLATAHDLLTQANWTGAFLRDVVGQAVQPFVPARFDVDGPDVLISPRHVLSFAMAIHELATNAVKHGALSVPAGRVFVGWTVDSGVLAFSWREAGGPAVTAPTRRGFGTRLLERSLCHDFGGTTKLDYAPDGVRWHTTVPLGQ